MNKTIITISSIVLGLAVVVIIGAFYWFQIRPGQIRKECWSYTQRTINGEDLTPGRFVPDEIAVKYGGQKAIDDFYNNCLREHGLEK